LIKFTGYFGGWDKCPDCGMRLIWAVKGQSLRHRPKGVAGTGRKTHDLIMRKKAEADPRRAYP